MTPLARQRRHVAELAARCELDRQAMDAAAAELSQSVRRNLFSRRGLLAGLAGTGAVAALLSRPGRQRAWPVAALMVQALPVLARLFTAGNGVHEGGKRPRRSP